MKKYLIGFGLLACVVAAASYLTLAAIMSPEQAVSGPVAVLASIGNDQPAQAQLSSGPGSVVFEMKYRGLTCEKDELRYNSYWGFGSRSDTDSPFVKAVKSKVKDAHLVYNAYFEGAQWSAVEIKDRIPMALYFDLDANGKLCDNERILPIKPIRVSSNLTVEFVTPDFVMKTQDGRSVPFRTLLQVSFYGENDTPNCMWSPACVLEGKAQIDGEPMTLILFASGFSGLFDEFGRASYALLSGDEQAGQYVPRRTLSSLLNHKGQFYRLQMQSGKEKGQAAQVILQRDTTPTGELAVSLVGEKNLKTRLSNARIVGAEDDKVQFDLSEGQAKLPKGRYRLQSGNVGYGDSDDNEWRASFEDGPEVTISPDIACKVELDKLTLSVRTIDEMERYAVNPTEKTAFKRGTRIYLSPKVSGANGAVFSRFSQKASESNGYNYNDKPPHVRIVDAAGKEVVSATMEYG